MLANLRDGPGFWLLWAYIQLLILILGWVHYQLRILIRETIGLLLTVGFPSLGAVKRTVSYYWPVQDWYLSGCIIDSTSLAVLVYLLSPIFHYYCNKKQRTYSIVWVLIISCMCCSGFDYVVPVDNHSLTTSISKPNLWLVTIKSNSVSQYPCTKLMQRAQIGWLCERLWVGSTGIFLSGGFSGIHEGIYQSRHW